MPLAPGTRLGPYEILSAIGAGGMGEVYRARDSRLEREVAIKVLPEHLAQDSELRARFEREAKVVAALSHPNILAIFDFGVEQGLSYAVTELLEGETLGSRLARSPLGWRKALEIGIAVADGLSAAHSKDIIHRDIKPENIFLTADGRVKILDFGLARYKPREVAPTAGADSAAPTEPARTAWGAVMGTVGYMSPEQVRGAKLDARSDLFSFGCVLYEMLTTQRAFRRPTPNETAAAILKDPTPELARSGVEVPLGLDRLIEHCLEKDPQQRFHSAHDLAFALRHILTGSGASNPLAASGLSRPRIAAWIGVAALAGLLGAAGFYWFDQRPRSIDSLAVLPFSGTGLLGDRLTENLINRLSQTPRLRVAPRASVFRYKGADADPHKVGRDLRVHAVLSGRVVEQGDSVNIQAELIDVEEESQIWGRQYERKRSEIAAVQEEIASAIAGKLRLRQDAEEQDREGWQKPRELLARIRIKPGDVVADIGAGFGFMVPYLVEATGPRGKVIAEEIRPDFVARIEQRARAHRWNNVTAVLGTDRDPHLPAGVIDLAFILMSYHDFEYPGDMLSHIRRALKPEGRLVVVDRYQSQGHGHIRADRDAFAAEIEASGFHLLSQFDHAMNQYALIFQKEP